MMHIEIMAMLCHNVNKAYCQAMGDNSQVDWFKAPDNIKESARAGVRHRLNNPNATPEDMHNSWMEFKIKDGWVYGEVKDAEKKTHPSLRPYSELPASEKAKDYIFSAIVSSFNAMPSSDSKAIMNMNFNPGGNEDVTAIKFFSALLYTVISETKLAKEATKLPGSGGSAVGYFHVQELGKRALQDLELVQMTAVKAVTR